VAESVNSTLGLEQTLETLVRLTPMLVGVTRCAIMQWDQLAASFVGGAVYGLDMTAESEFIGLRIHIDDALVEALSTSEEPIPAGGDLERQIPSGLDSLFNCTALLFLPLIAKGTLVGCMIVDYQVGGEHINQRRMHILTGIAHQSALALQTARLLIESTERQRLERELEVASGIQHSFLPQQLPRLPGWGLATFYRAARQVGGDFYDFIPLKGNKFGIVIADVADKGVPAALFMALSRTNIRAAAFSRDEPVATLARVNELLLADSRSDLFVTVWYGVWDPDSGEITYASAGHNPPLLLRANGDISELTARGIALNVVETPPLEEKQVCLEPGDVLVAYTDGISDALRSDGVEFGVMGLRSITESSLHYGAEDIRQRIVDTVDKFTGSTPQFDDLTLVILKNEGKP
jgi:serine phosphatase RsbU (regulator of sigma subunit)